MRTSTQARKAGSTMGAKMLSLVAVAAATRHFAPAIWNTPSSDVVITNYGPEILPAASLVERFDIEPFSDFSAK